MFNSKSTSNNNSPTKRNKYQLNNQTLDFEAKKQFAVKIVKYKRSQKRRENNN